MGIKQTAQVNEKFLDIGKLKILVIGAVNGHTTGGGLGIVFGG